MRVAYEFAESLRIALNAIYANKARGILTTLGIIIGILGVVTTMTAANGLRNSFKESVSALGSDVLYVSRRPWIIMGDFFKYRNRPRLEFREAELLEARLEGVRAVNPFTGVDRPVKYRSKELNGLAIVGTTDKHLLVSTGIPEVGRFLTAADVRSKRRVCVVGADLRERLFEGADPLNKRIRIGRYDFLVVGMMEKQGSSGFFGGPNFDSQIYVPITTLMKLYGSTQRDFDFAVKAPDGASLEDFEYELVGEMRKIRGLHPTEEDSFSINKMDSIVAAFNNVMGVIWGIGLLITGISLLVGAIGVMNIMFVSVTERTREIGIRKALGARRRAILAQFVFESGLICLMGGIVGVLLALGTTAAIDRFLMPASISPAIVVIALAVSVLTGVFAGIVPAFRASRFNPVESLRYE